MVNIGRVKSYLIGVRSFQASSTVQNKRIAHAQTGHTKSIENLEPGVKIIGGYYIHLGDSASKESILREIQNSDG